MREKPRAFLFNYSFLAFFSILARANKIIFHNRQLALNNNKPLWKTVKSQLRRLSNFNQKGINLKKQLKKMGKLERFTNLSSSIRIVIYILNALLLVGFLLLFALTLLIGFMPFLYALGSIGKGGGTFLAVMFLMVLWFLASFGCFIGVIVIAALKNRWSWTFQFLPFITAVIFYSILVIATHL
jgi:hypothetical protein